jgi:hypothetical protein
METVELTAHCCVCHKSGSKVGYVTQSGRITTHTENPSEFASL